MFTKTLAAALLFAALPATAQTLPPNPPVPPTTNGSVTTVAPTPNLVPERVAPADRAGNNTSDPAGPIASTPFSAGPQGGGGAQGGTSLRGTESPGSPSTPSLGK